VSDQGLLFGNEQLVTVTSPDAHEPTVDEAAWTRIVQMREGVESAAIDKLRDLANVAIAGHEQDKRRPTYAPTIIASGPLADLLYSLKWTETQAVEGEPSFARLWARFVRVRDVGWRCWGFELRVGRTHSGKRFWEALQLRSGRWQIGPRWLPPKLGGNSRYELLVRATELGAEHVLKFAGEPL
jgi:hypothetical protein